MTGKKFGRTYAGSLAKTYPKSRRPGTRITTAGQRIVIVVQQSTWRRPACGPSQTTGRGGGLMGTGRRTGRYRGVWGGVPR